MSDKLDATLESNSNSSLGGASSSLGGPSVSEVTHCHHEGLVGPHYTMRPYYDYYSPLSLAAVAAAHKMSSSPSSPGLKPHNSGKPDSFVPMLHVRRDLHHKSPMISGHSSTITSSSAGGLMMNDAPGPSFLGSIPIRKRPMGPNGEPQIIIPAPSSVAGQSATSSSSTSNSPHFHPAMHHLAASGHHAFNLHHSPQSTSSCSPSSSQASAGVKGKEEQGGNYLGTPGTSKEGESGGGGVVAGPSKPQPPKKTGFSIEDIMRR